MKKGIQSIILFIIGGICFSSCSDSDNSTSIIPKDNTDQVLVKNLSEYVTVKDLQWTLSISKDEAYQLGFSSDDYNESMKIISRANKSLEEAKKDTSTIIHLFLPNEQIVMKHGKVEFLKRVETKACYNRYDHSFVTSVNIPENSGEYVSFVTTAHQYRVCIEGKINENPYSHMVGLWEMSILDDIWKVNRVITGTGAVREFELEWFMGGVGFPVNLLDWKFFLHYTHTRLGQPTSSTVSFYTLN